MPLWLALLSRTHAHVPTSCTGAAELNKPPPRALTASMKASDMHRHVKSEPGLVLPATQDLRLIPLSSADPNQNLSRRRQAGSIQAGAPANPFQPLHPNRPGQSRVWGGLSAGGDSCGGRSEQTEWASHSPPQPSEAGLLLARHHAHPRAPMRSGRCRSLQSRATCALACQRPEPAHAVEEDPRLHEHPMQ